MRKQALRIAATISLFALLSAGAQAQGQNSPVKFHVPFDFQIGRQTLPAGDYLVSFVNRDSNMMSLLIKSGEGRGSRIMQMTPVEAGRARSSAALVFNRYGGSYFLTQFWTPGARAGLKVRKSRAERAAEVAGDAGQTTVELAAVK